MREISIHSFIICLLYCMVVYTYLIHLTKDCTGNECILIYICLLVYITSPLGPANVSCGFAGLRTVEYPKITFFSFLIAGNLSLYLVTILFKLLFSTCNEHVFFYRTHL